MSLVLDNKRVNGRWVRESVDIQKSLNTGAWREAMKRVGVVFDHAPDLYEPGRDGALTLDAAYQQAVDRRDAERNKLTETKRHAARSGVKLAPQ